jgi:hypothetical protein
MNPGLLMHPKLDQKCTFVGGDGIDKNLLRFPFGKFSLNIK